MQTQRDPRINPREGDVIRHDRRGTRTVLRADPWAPHLMIRDDHGDQREIKRPTLSQYRLWARMTVIVQRGSDPVKATH